MNNILKAKKLVFLLITISACAIFAPLINTMQQQKVATKPRYETEFSSYDEKIEFLTLLKEKKEVEFIKFIEKNNLDPNYKFDENNILINLVIKQCLPNVLKYIIKKGANVNIDINTEKDNTPLFYAISSSVKEGEPQDRWLEIIKILVENGANIYEKQKYGTMIINLVNKESPIYKYLYNLYPYEEKYTTNYSDSNIVGKSI